MHYGIFERYETEFYHTLMDDIHESYYLIDGFDYEGLWMKLVKCFMST